MNRYRICVFALLLTGGAALAQQPPPPGGPDGPPPPTHSRRPPMERAFHSGVPGRWWSNPEMVQKLGLTDDQQKKMDDIFQQSRLKLIDLNASLEKEELIMEPLMSADQPDEAKAMAQIDRVAQARAALEEANAKMLLKIRLVLTVDQWKKLQSERRGPRHRPEGREGAENMPPTGEPQPEAAD